MGKRIWKFSFMIFMIACIVLPEFVLAEDSSEILTKGTTEIEWSTGYGWSTSSNRHVNALPLNFRWGYVLTDPKNILFFKGNFELLGEGTVAYLFHGQRKYGIGIDGLLRYNLLTGKSWLPYMQAGFGVFHTNLEMENFPNDFNFSSQFGLGIKYFVSRNMAICGEYRIVHYSNADLYDKNDGLNMNSFCVGSAWYFK